MEDAVSNIVGVCVLKHSPIAESSLGPLNPVYRLWTELEGDEKERVSFAVLFARPLPEVRAIRSASSAESVDDDLKQVFLPLSPSSLHQVSRQVSNFCEYCGAAGVQLRYDGNMPNIALTLPAVVARLVAHRALTAVVFSLHDRSLRHYKFAPMRASLLELRKTLVAKSADAGNNPALLTEAGAISIVESIEKWRPLLLKAVEGQDTSAEFETEVQQVLSQVGLHAQAMRQASGQEHIFQKEGKYQGYRKKRVDRGTLKTSARYRSVFVVRTLMLTHTLRQAGLMKVVCHLAMRVAFPDCVFSTLEALLEEMQFPSSAQISRWRFQCDVAVMLWSRQRLKKALEKHTGQVSSQIVTDGSMQGGREWLLSEVRLAGTTGDLAEALKLAWTVIPETSRIRQRPSLLSTLPASQTVGLPDRLEGSFVEIAECLSVVLLPLAGLGKGRTNLPHKIHSLLHQLFLTVGDELIPFIRTIVAACTDFGTESGIVHTKPIPMDEVYPLGVPDRIEDESGPLGAEHPSDVMLDMCGALFVPDALHILHNITGDVLESLQNFAAVKPHFKAIANFMKHKYNREAVQAACFSDGQSACFSFLFESWNASLIEWRWGSVVAFVEKLEAVKVPLQRFWSLHRYQSGLSGARKRQRQQDDVDFGDVFKFDEAVRSETVWAFTSMLRRLIGCLEQLRGWCESCPCHFRGMDSELGEAPALGAATCPFRGCRGPELARGGPEMFLEEVVQISSVMLEAELHQVGGDVRLSVMTDFAEGHRHLLFMLSLKFSHWKDSNYIIAYATISTTTLAIAIVEL